MVLFVFLMVLVVLAVAGRAPWSIRPSGFDGVLMVLVV